MFKLARADAPFWWKVSFKWVNEDGSGHTTETFAAQFKRLQTDDFVERTRHIVDREQQGESALPQIREFVDDVFLDFKEIEFDGERDQVRAFLLNDITIVTAMYKGYNQALLGRELTEGN